MEEPPPIPAVPSQDPGPPATSLAARLLNVFAIPGAVFEEVKASPFSVLNWLVPLLLLATVGVTSAMLIFSQPSVSKELRERQTSMVQRHVKAGKMTQAEADKTLALASKFLQPQVMSVLAGIAALVGSVTQVFCWALALWLLGRWFLKVSFGFWKTLEVAGLGMMIAVLGGVITLILMVSLAPQGQSSILGLVVRDLEAIRKSRLFMIAVEVFSFWLVGVMAAGLARLAGVPWFRALFLVFAYWLAKESFFAIIGLGALSI